MRFRKNSLKRRVEKLEEQAHTHSARGVIEPRVYQAHQDGDEWVTTDIYRPWFSPTDDREVRAKTIEELKEKLAPRLVTIQVTETF